MSIGKEESTANHLLSLIEKKNVWEIDIISSILNIDSSALSSFVKTLPMAYGLSIAGKKLSVTPELVRDVKEEIKNSFINWYQKIEPDSFSQKQMLHSDSSQIDYKKKILEDQKSRIKISVYGENYLVQKTIDHYLSRTDVQSVYEFRGGYEPIDFEKIIGNEAYECQFSIINYNRDLLSLSPLLYENPIGFLFIFNPLDALQVEKTKDLTKILTEKRDSDLFVTFLAILPDMEGSQFIDEVAQILSKMVEQLEGIDKFKVSFAILSVPEQIERKINDLIQISQLFSKAN